MKGEHSEDDMKRMRIFGILSCCLALLLALTACGGSGSYTMEEDELVLDSGLRFSLDESGGLLDSDGHALLPSELPE